MKLRQKFWMQLGRKHERADLTITVNGNEAIVNGWATNDKEEMHKYENKRGTIAGTRAHPYRLKLKRDKEDKGDGMPIYWHFNKIRKRGPHRTTMA